MYNSLLRPCSIGLQRAGTFRRQTLEGKKLRTMIKNGGKTLVGTRIVGITSEVLGCTCGIAKNL